MHKPAEIVFRSIDHSPAMEAAVRDRLDKLDERHGNDELMGCVVTIDAPHRHHHNGRLYEVDIRLSVKGGELVVNRDPQKDHSHEDAYVAIRDSFDALERQLKKHLQKQRPQDVKTHQGPPQGRVDRLFVEDDYGFITTPAGRHVYFHRNAIVDADLGELEVGDPVEFVERMGDAGPQASTVKLLSEMEATEAGPMPA